MPSGLRVTVDVFSGRPNPVVALTGRAATAALAALKPSRGAGRGDSIARLPESTLGYRGMVVEQLGRAAGGLPKSFRVANGDVFAGKKQYHAGDDFEQLVLDRRCDALLEESSAGNGRRWTAYGGVVSLEGDDAVSRNDVGRRFETMLLETAPQGLLPLPLW